MCKISIIATSYKQPLPLHTSPYSTPIKTLTNPQDKDGSVQVCNFESLQASVEEFSGPQVFLHVSAVFWCRLNGY